MVVVIMGLFDSLSSFSDGAAGLASYAWILWIFIPIALLIGVAYVWKLINKKNKQWTHKLRIRRVMAGGRLTSEDVIRMRRFPLIKRAEVFELERPLLGSYLMPELDSYTGKNEFSIIIDVNNRIYVSMGETFCPDKSCINVSAKHAEIDISRSDLRSDYQNVNKTSERLEWSKIAKFALLGLFIIAAMVVCIKGIEQWGSNHQADAQKASAEAEAYAQLGDMFEVVTAAINTQAIILEELQELKGTKNIQGVIKGVTNEKT